MEYRAVVAIVLGAIILLWPGRHATKANRQHDQRLADLRSGAEERYFEEKRALETYRPPRRELTWRLLGALFLLGGLSFLFLQ